MKLFSNKIIQKIVLKKNFENIHRKKRKRKAIIRFGTFFVFASIGLFKKIASREYFFKFLTQFNQNIFLINCKNDFREKLCGKIYIVAYYMAALGFVLYLSA